MILAACSLACGSESGGVEPVEVRPPGDGATRGDAPGAPGGAEGAIWVVDAHGEPAGVLFRRGTDESVAGRVVYDFVTVFHPGSGLFYELTMSDGEVRFPATIYFSGFNCGTPVGVAAGGCVECRSGYGAGFLHGGRWWRLRGGETRRQMSMGSTRSGGISTECVAHGTSNALGFPVEEVPASASPPTSFAAPMAFAYR